MHASILYGHLPEFVPILEETEGVFKSGCCETRVGQSTTLTGDTGDSRQVFWRILGTVRPDSSSTFPSRLNWPREWRTRGHIYTVPRSHPLRLRNSVRRMQTSAGVARGSKDTEGVSARPVRRNSVCHVTRLPRAHVLSPCMTPGLFFRINVAPCFFLWCHSKCWCKQVLREERVYFGLGRSQSITEWGQRLRTGTGGRNWSETVKHRLQVCSPRFQIQPRLSYSEPGLAPVDWVLLYQLTIKKSCPTNMPAGQQDRGSFSVEVHSCQASVRTSKVQLGEPMTLIRLLIGIWVRSCRNPDDQKTGMSMKVQSSSGTAHESWDLRVLSVWVTDSSTG